MLRAIAFAAFLATTFFQVFSFIFLPYYAVIPGIVYIGAMGTFGLVAISRQNANMLLIYLVGSVISEIITACSFGWTVSWLTDNCGNYFYHEYNCTPGIINASFSGLSFVTYPVMFFLFIKLRKMPKATAPTAPQSVPPGQGVFMVSPQSQQTQYFQAVQAQPTIMQPVVLQTSGPQASAPGGSWH